MVQELVFFVFVLGLVFKDILCAGANFGRRIPEWSVAE